MYPSLDECHEGRPHRRDDADADDGGEGLHGHRQHAGQLGEDYVREADGTKSKGGVHTYFDNDCESVPLDLDNNDTDHATDGVEFRERGISLADGLHQLDDDDDDEGIHLTKHEENEPVEMLLDI